MRQLAQLAREERGGIKTVPATGELLIDVYRNLAVRLWKPYIVLGYMSKVDKWTKYYSITAVYSVHGCRVF